VAPNGTTLDAAQFVPISTDAGGNAVIPNWPSAGLNPTNTGYLLVFPDGTIWYYLAPALPTGYQGAYNPATAYHKNAGTKLSPADVVTSGGIYYQAILDSTGSAPPSASWQVWPGEPLVWHLTQITTAGGVVIDTTGVAASPNLSALADDPITPALSLDDDLRILAARAGLALRTITTSTTLLETDDWILADATAGNLTLTLMSASVRVRPLTIIRKDAGAHTVSLARAGADLINGTASLALNTQYLWAVLKPDTLTSWYAQTGGADATPTSVGVVEIDQSPASGHPVALTVPRLGSANGVAPLAGDSAIPSAFLPTPTGSLAEAARWIKHGGNTTPTAIISASQVWEGVAVYEPSVLYDGGLFKMWYGGGWASGAIGYATSVDGITYTKYASNPVIGQGGSGIAGFAARVNVIKVGATFYGYYSDASGGGNLKVTTSTDGIAWGTPVVALAAGTWANSTILIDPTGTWHMLVEKNAGSFWEIHYYTSANGITWTAQNSGNPLTTLQVHSGGTYGGACLLPYPINGLYHAWFHASPGTGVLPDDIYHATSPDFITWTIIGAAPVLARGSEPAGTDQLADPCVVEINGTSWLYYDLDNNTTSTASIGVATIAATLHQVVSGSPVNLTDPSTTEGDLLYRTGGVLARIGIGTTGQVLTSNGTDPSWAPPTGGASHIGEPVLLNPGAAPDFVLLAGDVVVL
jgi:hypothetical protein